MKVKTLEQLWRDYQQKKQPDIKEKLIESYIGLVKIVAGRLSIYLNHYVELDDLIGYGVIGLIDAIDKFDLEKNVKFETYASLRIRGAILDEIRKLDWVPRTLRKKQKDMNKIQTALENELGRVPTEEEMAQALGVDKRDYGNMLQEINITNLVFIEDYQVQVSQLTDSKVHTPEEHIQTQEVFEHLKMAIEKLPEREKLVITLYYYEELTLKEISSVLEVSESRVSQIHTKAISRVRMYLGKYHKYVAL